jgi:hypothetical protein
VRSGFPGDPPPRTWSPRTSSARPSEPWPPPPRRGTGARPVSTSSPSARTTRAASSHFFLNFGFRPSIGLHFFWNDTFVERNKVTADAAWGGSNWVTLAVGDRYSFSKASSIAVEAHWNRRPDNLYFGIGPETTTDFKSRYGTDVVGR